MEHNNENENLRNYIIGYISELSIVNIEKRRKVFEMVDRLLEANHYEHSTFYDRHDNENENTIVSVDPVLKQFLISNHSLYHYTSFDTALKILNGGLLRFNSLSNQIDPNEIAKGNLTVGVGSEEDYGTAFEDIQNFTNTIEDYVKYHQSISFSSNTQIVNDINVTMLQYVINEVNKELYIQDYGFRHYQFQPGFDKSRMWETYADRYSGVCLVFNKDFIVNRAIDEKLEYGYIKYLSKQRNVVYEKRKEKKLLNPINSTYFHKRIDYRDECEFRLLTNSPDEEFFDISNSLVGIIYGPNSEAKLYQKIIKNSFHEFDLKHISYEISGNSISNIFYEMD